MEFKYFCQQRAGMDIFVVGNKRSIPVLARSQLESWAHFSIMITAPFSKGFITFTLSSDNLPVENKGTVWHDFPSSLISVFIALSKSLNLQAGNKTPSFMGRKTISLTPIPCFLSLDVRYFAYFRIETCGGPSGG